MKAINLQAKMVMDTLTKNWNSVGNGRKIDNAKGTFKAVHVERVSHCNLGYIYSIAHYHEQEGDLMRDPEMEFVKGGDGDYYPISFWQDSPLKRDEVVAWSGGKMVGYNVEQQMELVIFANEWMRNIKRQQGL